MPTFGNAFFFIELLCYYHLDQNASDFALMWLMPSVVNPKINWCRLLLMRFFIELLCYYHLDQNASDFLSLIEMDRSNFAPVVAELRNRRCQCCDAPPPVQFAHIAKRKKHSVNQIIRKSYPKLSIKKKAFVTSIEACFMLCEACHKDYDLSNEIYLKRDLCSFPVKIGSCEFRLFQFPLRRRRLVEGIIEVD